MLTHLKGVIAPRTLSIFVLASSLFGCGVVRQHGLKEGIDQAGHYIMGFGLTTYNLAGTPNSCKALDKTLDFAVWREFNQKSKHNQETNAWCHEGCHRDLKYWIKGSQKSVELWSRSSCPKKVGDLPVPRQ